jgi:hypothetical protein
MSILTTAIGEAAVQGIRVVVVSLLLLVLAGCAGDGVGKEEMDADQDKNGPADAATADGQADVLPAETSSGCEGFPGQICCAGEFNGCVDNRSILACAEGGMAWETLDCLDDEGKDTLCMTSPDKPAGYCGLCIPGNRKCQDDDVILECDQFGTGWKEVNNCKGASTGQICVAGGCVALCDVNEKLNMYMGCDFWGADLDNAFVPGGRAGYYDAAGAQFSIVVSNPSYKYPADVKIFTNEGQALYSSLEEAFPTEPLAPGELRIYDLPRRDVDGTVVAPLAYRVQASIPITAYQFNPLENVDVFSNDASLLLPSNVMGKYYFVMTREQTFDELRSFLTVIAIRTGETTVSVDVTAPTLVGENARMEEKIEHLEPGDTYQTVLKQFDVLNLESDEIGSDMTGSMVLANRDVVVYGGSEASNAPNTNHCNKALGVCEWDGKTPCKGNSDCTSKFNTCCADHLEEQLFPVKSWGTRYLASKLYPRNQELDVYRIIAAEDNTKVTTVPPQTNIPVLNKGEWVDFESKENFEIIAKKPIMVGQFMASEQAPDPNVNGVPQPGDAGTGDPAFILLIAVEQSRKDYVFLAPDKYEFDYVTIIVPEGAKVWFDCHEIDPALIAANCQPIDPDEFELFGTGEFATTKFLVEDGVHRIYSDEDAAVYVYGYDQYVSYGYPAGLNIKDLGLIKEPGE